MDEEAKQERIRQLTLLLDSGRSKETIIQTGNLNGLTIADIPLELLERLEEKGIQLEPSGQEKYSYMAIGKKSYQIFQSGSGSYEVVLPKSWVRQTEAKGIIWKINLRTNHLVAIPVKQQAEDQTF